MLLQNLRGEGGQILPALGSATCVLIFSAGDEVHTVIEVVALPRRHLLLVASGMVCEREVVENIG